MMDKIEKYKNYIADDLINSTEIDFNGQTIQNPFNWDLFYRFNEDSYVEFSYYIGLEPVFEIYLIRTYGVSRDEVLGVWDIYKEKLRIKIANG